MPARRHVLPSPKSTAACKHSHHRSLVWVLFVAPWNHGGRPWAGGHHAHSASSLGTVATSVSTSLSSSPQQTWETKKIWVICPNSGGSA